MFHVHVQMYRNRHAQVISKEYGRILHQSKEVRTASQIYNLRNSNNGIKSWLIRRVISTSPLAERKSLSVLDVGAGVGGDLFKFLHQTQVQEYIGLDISKDRVNAMIERYNTAIENKTAFGQANVEFHCLDFLQLPSDLVQRWSNRFDLVNMQFVMHYFMQSNSTVHRWLAWLKAVITRGGARVIITVIDWPTLNGLLTVRNASTTVQPHTEAPLKPMERTWSNSICRVTGYADQSKETWYKYRFSLLDCVDSDEYAVDVPWFTAIAEKYYKLRTVEQGLFKDQPAECTQHLSRDELQVFNLYRYLILYN